jgi:hypothetical protein
MSATHQPAAPGDRCGKWMPRRKTYCARRQGHAGECKSAGALAERRERATGRRRGVRRSEDPATRVRWYRAYKFNRLGITEKEFNAMLERQGHA